MLYRVSFLIVLYAIFSGPVSGQSCDNRAADLKGKKILLFTKTGEGYVHDNIPASIDMFFELSRTEGFRLDTTTHSGVFSSDTLMRYDAVVFSNTNNRVFESEKEREGLVRFIRAGKGFAGIHSAGGTEREWGWFKQMIGGTFDFHPPLQEFTVQVTDHRHPSAAEIPLRWQVKDELYIMKEMNPSVRVIMVSDFSSPSFKSDRSLPDTFGKLFPCVWCNTFDGGRQWFTALGHRVEDYQDPLFINHVLGGLRWIVRE